MQTEEAELLALTEDASANKLGLTTILIDLSSIPHINDPIFFRTLIARIDVVPKDGKSRMYRLAHHIVAIVTPDDQTHLAVQAVDRLDAFLKRSGRGAARHQEFSIKTEANKLAKICRKLMSEVDNTRQPSRDSGELQSFMRLFESLRNADISNLVREQAIWDLTNLHQPTSLASALTVSIDALDDMFGQDIRANPWLFEKVIEVVDIRMLDHLVEDRLKADRTYTVNVNSTVVIESELDEAFADIPMTTRKRIILEVPYVEALHERADFDRMVDDLKHEKFPIALDGVRWTSLPKLEVPPENFAYLKVMWDPHLTPGNETDWAAFSACVAKLGPERFILYNCVDGTAIPDLHALGITLFQGRGVEEFIRRDRVELLHAQERDEQDEQLADETDLNGGSKGILGKFLGG
ncbi:hypothetical protein [Nisaea denitrificans]|uniref:hypothetical protein n=1 Tax=Nisaea denitrificans TaxID=390877 RepID=UPI0003F78F04|nr:hypothetical protein [Nisaea denitrificans]